MKSVCTLVISFACALMPGPGAAQDDSALPAPLGLPDVIRLATARRDEIAAARARVDSLTQAGDQQVYNYPGKQPRQ